MSSSYRMELDKWLAQLDVKADRVLDIGGAQVKMPGRVKSWDVKEYLIADLPNPHEDSPKPDVELDLNVEYFNDDYPHVEPPTVEQFDQIFCLEVFDYVWSPKDAMHTISNLLEDGGTAWITFPSVYPLHQPIEDDALRYMPGGIKKLAASAGLAVEETIPRRPETDLWQRFFTAERMRAAKHVDHSVTGYICKFKKEVKT